MLKKKTFLATLLIILTISFINVSSFKSNTIEYKKPNIPISIPIINKLNNKQTHTNNKLIIKKINIDKEMYELNDKKNNVEENITFLKGSIMPDEDNSIVFIAAHSGTGNIAYFKNLDKLEKHDEITLIYHGKTYKYYVKNILEENKTGYINISKEKPNQLVLTTCAPNKKDKQLIINCIEKDT